MLRAIREIKPKYIVGENVFGLLNWNGGMVFDEVHSDLELEGYEVQAVVIPAAAVNAPHGRDRVWFVAYSIDNRHNSERNEASEKNGIQGKHRKEMDTREFDGTIISRDVTNTQFKSEGSDGGTNDETEGNIRRQNSGNVSGEFRRDGNATDTECSGGIQSSENLQPQKSNGVQSIGDGREWDAANASSRRISRYGGESKNGKFQTNESNQNNSEQFRRMDWEKFPTQPPICGGNDGFSLELDGITFPKWRNESIKAYGNAIVPQVAYQIFKALELCK
jgi:DNA (cytosine-5)-methyltransferase 1